MPDISKNRLLNQIGLGTAYKILSVSLNFIIIGYLIRVLGPEQYGIWVTVFTIMTWISYLDFGMNSSLHTLVPQVIDYTKNINLKNTILSGYIVLICISLSLFLVVHILLSMPTILSFVYGLFGGKIKLIMFYNAISIACILLILNLITGIVGGLQLSSLTHLSSAIAGCLNLFIIYQLNKISIMSVENIILSYGLSMFISLLLVTLIILRQINFFSSLKDYKFQIKVLQFAKSFFLINFSVIILFSTDRVLISVLHGPNTVTEYDLVYRLIGIVLMMHSLINMPAWGPYAEKWKSKDLVWIKNQIKNQLMAGILLVIFALFIILFAADLVYVWTKLDLEITYFQKVSLLLLVLVNIANNIFATFINSTGQLKMQTMGSIIAAIINIPVSVFLVRYFSLSYEGVVLGSVLALCIPGFLLLIQSKNLLSQKSIN